jgi:PAS domain S-box-containing protein
MDNSPHDAEKSTQHDRQILDVLPAGTLITRISDGTILFANRSIAKMLGLEDISALIGTLVPNFYWDPDERQHVLSLFRAEGSLVGYEMRARRLDGSMFWVEIALQVFEFEGEKVILTTVLDITSRKESEQRLQQNEQLLQVIFNALPQPVIVTQISDGTVLYANQQLGDLIGIPLEQIVGLRTPDFYANPADRLRFVQQLQKEGRVNAAEIQLKRHDGTFLWTEITIELTNFQGAQATVAIIEDISARKQVELKLRQLAAIIESSSEAILSTTPDGTLISWNPAAEHLFGYTPDEIIGQPVRMLAPEELQEQARGLLMRLAQGEHIPATETVRLTKDGRRLDVLLSASAIHDDAGNVAGFSATLTDITERKRAETELQNAISFADSIINALPGTFYMVDTAGNLVRWNTNEEKVLGYSADELRVLPAMHTIAEEYRPQAAQALQKAFTEGEALVEVSIITKSGNLIPYLLSGTRLVTEAGVFIVGVGIDISERKLAELELQREKALSDSIINGMPGVFYLFDTTGRMIRWNQNYEVVTGYSSEETAQRSALDVVAAEDKARAYDAIQKVFSEGQAGVEAQIENRFGERYFYYLTGRRVQIGDDLYLTGSGYDISDRKRLEAELQTLLERRGYQVQLSTEISQEIAAASDLTILFERVVTLVKERLGYYHTQLLRYDPTQDAVVLIAGYGETGKKMLALNHRMPMGRGLIGLSAQTGQTVLRPDLAAGDPNWQPNPLLPETKGEIAVPIKLGQQILGVLDVQSSQVGALGDDDRLLLEGLCGQIAIAIEQTRLRQEMTEHLEELNTLYRSMNRDGWNTFVRTAELPAGFLFDQTGIRLLTPEVSINTETFASAPLSVPGGVSVGTLALSDDPDRPLTPEDHNFLQQISEQVALALESARLFSQTQSTLAMTETLYAGSERIIRAGTMSEALAAVMETTALRRFGRASIMIFNRPWTAQPPDTGLVVAQWTQSGNTAIVPMGAVFPIGQLPFGGFMRRDAPVFIADVETDGRLDTQTRAMISGIGRSMAFFPLVSGDQWFGFLITASNEPVSLKPDALRQVESLVGQAATVIQSIRLYEQAQGAAQRERILREVTTQVRASVDADTILRTAVRELGQALGRETFVRIGGTSATTQNNPAQEPLTNKG